MEDKSKGKRALLSERNTALALSAIEDLKKNNCKLNLSDLVNEIVAQFFSKHYLKSKKSLEKRFFDRKKYLQKILVSQNGDNLDQAIKEYVKTISQPKKESKIENS